MHSIISILNNGQESQTIQYNINGDETMDENGNQYVYNTFDQLVKEDLNMSSQTSIQGQHVKSLNFLNDGKSNLLTLNSDDNSLNNSFNYSAYGHVSSLNNEDENPENNFLFNSEYQDNQNKLIQMGSRDYDPEIQRFMTPDSFNVWNKYNFSNGNPISNIDPSGHLPKWANILISTLIMVGSTALLAVDGGTSSAEEVAALDDVSHVANIGGDLGKISDLDDLVDTSDISPKSSLVKQQ